ncbi:MAG: ABC transporter permease [Rhizobiales bacterium]|nr:ABC transporter permease [Hyphomicrobiales bacterium]
MNKDLYKIQFQDNKIVLYLYGRWTLFNLGKIEHILMKEFKAGFAKINGVPEYSINGKALELVDTSAVLILKKLEYFVLKKQPNAVINLIDLPDEYYSLTDKLKDFNIGRVYEQPSAFVSPTYILGKIGKSVVNTFNSFVEMFKLFGLFFVGLGQLIMRPQDFKFTSMVYHVQNMTIPAIAIVAAVSFMVGAVLTEQAAVRLAVFGAEGLVVGFIGMVSARETSILLTGMLVAGRSSSSITAEIGSMRMNEEIDAMKVIGLDVMKFLVMPRVMAMLIALPILTFIAIISGFAGSAVLLNVRYGMDFVEFIDRIYDNITIFDIGTALVKTPFIAVSLVMVACYEGMKVESNAASLGHHTTISVVKGLFLVIIIDSIVAIYFTQINHGGW